MNTGGPAFPCETIHPCGSHEQVDGLSIRDYFAAKAMQGWLANPKTDYGAEYETLANVFYGMADAMLKAREA